MRTNAFIAIFTILMLVCKCTCASFECSGLRSEHLDYNVKPTSKNTLLSFELLMKDNADWLLADYNAEINSDTISIFIPYLSHFSLKPQFSVGKKAKVYADGSQLISGISEVDFSRPVQIAVIAKGNARIYTVIVYNSGLPIICINTKNAQPIKSKSKWLDSTRMTIYLPDGTVDYDAGSHMAQVRGRGNSTWNTRTKQPYSLKLNVPSKILGMPENKHWCLLANYYDETLFKNDFALYLGRQYTNLEWTPHGQSVELVLNGRHLGNYFLCEQVRIAKNRVQGKYLIEIEQKQMLKKCDVVSMLDCKMNIADIDRKNGDIQTKDDIKYVTSIVNRFESELAKPNAKNSSKYKDYIDIESFADWYLVKELSKDVDANFITSCYFHIDNEGKIKMGPIWDFDRTFGDKTSENPLNATHKSDDFRGFNIVDNVWYTYLLKDPDFVSIVVQKLNRMLDDSVAISNYIDNNTEKLYLSAFANDLIYRNKLASYRNGTVLESAKSDYENKMESIKEFTFKRIVWIKENLKRKQTDANQRKRPYYKQNRRRNK